MALLGAGLVILAVIFLAPIERAFEAIEFASNIASGTELLKRKVALPARRTITYEVSGQRYLGDIYIPTGPVRAAAVAVPGVVADGKDDVRLVAFAMSLSRAGFLVLAPDIPNIRAFKIGSSDSDYIEAAVKHLASGASGPQKPIGIFAFSYAAGPALIAAMRPQTQRLVRFVCTAGAYYSVERAITFLTTGYYRSEKGDWLRGQPSPYAKWVFLVSNASRLDDPSDRKAIEEIADRKLANNKADISNLAKGLHAQGRAVYALMTNMDPGSVPSLIAALPDSVKAEIAALDLSTRDLSELHAHLILIHGLDDTLVPYTESIALAHAARGKAHLFLIKSFGHVEPQLSSLPDALKFWQAAYEVLSERDSASAK